MAPHHLLHKLATRHHLVAKGYLPTHYEYPLNILIQRLLASFSFHTLSLILRFLSLTCFVHLCIPPSDTCEPPSYVTIPKHTLLGTKPTYAYLPTQASPSISACICPYTCLPRMFGSAPLRVPTPPLILFLNSSLRRHMHHWYTMPPCPSIF